MKKLRWGVLSTANIGLTQGIPAIIRSQNAELIGLASRGDKGLPHDVPYSIPKFYKSYEELLLDPEIQAVYIPLPNHLHKEWALKAIQHGKHILSEKPAFLKANEAIEVKHVCEEHGVEFMEAFMYQFHPQHQRVQEIIASGEIGEVKFMRAAFSFLLEDKEENIRMKREMGGGSIYDIGCYCIHAIRTILQTEPCEVKTFARLDPISGVDLSAVVYMKLENGLDAVFDCSFEMEFRHEYEIVGTKGKISVPRAFRPDVNGSEGHIVVRSAGGERTEKIWGDQFKAQFEHFSKMILDGGKPVYTIDDTHKNMRVIEACYDSIDSGTSIRLSD